MAETKGIQQIYGSTTFQWNVLQYNPQVDLNSPSFLNNIGHYSPPARIIKERLWKIHLIS